MTYDPTRGWGPPVGRMEGPSDTLAVASPARPRPFLLQTDRCSARGVETRGIEVVEHHSRVLLTGLQLVGASCGNVLLAPAHARRELVTRAGTVSEVLLVTLDGLIAQWTPTVAPTQGDLRIAVRVPGERWSVEGSALRTDGADGVRLLVIDGGAEWSLREERDCVMATAVLSAAADRTGLRATWRPNEADAAAALARMGPARALQAEGDVSALRTRRLRTKSAPEIDDALAWALARADAAAPVQYELAQGEPFPLDPGARKAWAAMGAVASGHDRLGIDRESPLGILADARTAAWRGVPLAKEASIALGAQGDGLSAMAARDASAAWKLACRAALLACADAIEPRGRERAGLLRSAAAALDVERGAAPSPTTGRRLPTLGHAAAVRVDSVAAILAAALDLPDRGPLGAVDDPPPGALRALTALALLNDGQLERGQALLRAHLADGFAEGIGLWPDGGRIHDPGAAALVPLIVLEGLLGARSDAYHGRLRLAPRLPASWTRFEVNGIRIGDSVVRMQYERAEGRHRFRIAQSSGAVPVMLIFEPIVAAPERAGTWVDGAPADLTITRFGGFAQARVQLPLDTEREVAIAAG